MEKEKNKIIKPKLYLSFITRNSDEDIFFDYNERSDSWPSIYIETTEKRAFYYREKYSNLIDNKKDQKELNEIYNIDILFLARKSKKGYYELIWPIVIFNCLDTNNINKLDNKMWLLMKTENNNKSKPLYENENEEYYLSENDIIKFGLKKYEIIKLNIISKADSKKNQLSENNKDIKSFLCFPEKSLRPNPDDKKNKNEKTKSDTHNPIIKMCKCKNYIHFNCLKAYLKNNIKITHNSDKTVISYYCENFGCKKCKEPYPLKFNLWDDVTFCLINGLEPTEKINYMILESLTDVQNGKNIKNIFVIKLTNKNITIGKNENNDIIDKSSEISGVHAVLKFDEKRGKVTIINKGRFGTSVLIKSNVKLEIGQKIYF